LRYGWLISDFFGYPVITRVSAILIVDTADWGVEVVSSITMLFNAPEWDVAARRYTGPCELEAKAVGFLCLVARW